MRGMITHIGDLRFYEADGFKIPMTGTPYEHYTADQMNEIVGNYYKGIPTAQNALKGTALAYQLGTPYVNYQNRKQRRAQQRKTKKERKL